MPVPQLSEDKIATLSLSHLRRIVAVDSQSDERSPTIPTTSGQKKLAALLEGFFSEQGAAVERDDFANVIARLPGRGAGADKPPMALMVHIDTALGTAATDDLRLVPGWTGGAIPYAENAGLVVSVETYPQVEPFLGQTLVHGPGVAPFGLDDKLGLTHLMTLACLLRQAPEIEHPPLLLIGRPDEECGRMEAVEGLAARLAEQGVAHGYTVDGILPFEINVENFNAAMGAVRFDVTPGPEASGARLRLHLGGVNTHGATAKAEGSRSAVRFAAEILQQLRADGVDPAALTLTGFDSDPVRECDAVLTWVAADGGAALRAAVAKVVDPHRPRGASWHLAADPSAPARALPGAEAALRFVSAFLASDPGFTLLAEESEGYDGYSSPIRILRDDQGLRLDVRIRDFSPEGLQRRIDHLTAQAKAHGHAAEAAHQYVNMGPRLAPHGHLVAWAMEAGASVGVDPQRGPIRGGTGVDPFLDHGVPIANVGTGYFAPESEKEFTSLEMMARHALWLVALVQRAAAG
ncbi:MAG: hypothetical protein H6739_01665 [Alphaproteobacteria bacterium]|nr:hypothetical protein [Alphaproteobacteria bacterium]